MLLLVLLLVLRGGLAPGEILERVERMRGVEDVDEDGEVMNEAFEPRRE